MPRAYAPACNIYRTLRCAANDLRPLCIYSQPHVDAYNKVGSWKTIATQSNAPNLASAGDSQSYHRKASQSGLLHTRS